MNAGQTIAEIERLDRTTAQHPRRAGALVGVTKLSKSRVLISGVLSPLAALVLYALVYSILT